jgi:hypothetical protein
VVEDAAPLVVVVPNNEKPELEVEVEVDKAVDEPPHAASATPAAMIAPMKAMTLYFVTRPPPFVIACTVTL